MGHYLRQKDLEYLFSSKITVSSIVEDLDLLDISNSVEDFHEQMKTNNFDVFGVKKDGKNIGYVNLVDIQDQLEKEPEERDVIENIYKEFKIGELISSHTPILKTILLMKEKKRLFILENEKISGIITKADLQKIPVRVVLFGYISIFEHFLNTLINEKAPEINLSGIIPEEKIQEANRLLEQKKINKEEIDLIGCLTLSSKAKILHKGIEGNTCETIFNISKSKLSKICSHADKIRNSIYHSQKTISLNIKDKIMDNLLEMQKILDNQPLFFDNWPTKSLPN
ncbi:hypothetical protein NEF87_000476 [Candidatus Lokiarchaeum ossiferum]|uniref:CBS domain-containing protein n=1 Tax=Candidatus Lokiarchaeum ossiferum TaxID=2951803 RepID=A0ABY6HNR4_9ARCH|nr:hypothetical protein NEF87_000476 [Candidatus Lokiarchaeum sp. B-35]